MSAARHRFILVTIATVLGVALTARLGMWQLARASEKLALQSMIDSRGGWPALDGSALARSVGEAEAQHYRPIVARGRWMAGRTIFLDNRQMNGRPGFFMVTPLRLENRADAVLVQRGWAPRDIRDRTIVPAVREPAGVVEIRGTIAPPPSRLFEFSGVASGTIRQNLDLTAFSAEIAQPLAPVSILQADSPSTEGDGLLRQWPHPAVDVQKHYGYAFQWFAMCALMTGLYVWFQLFRPRLRRAA